MAKAATKTDKTGADDKPKKSKLQLAKEKITKDHGAGSVMQGKASIGNVQVWSSEIADLDIVLGCGGIPRGRIMEIYGHESGGKTTTALSLIAACQHTDFPVVGSPGEVRKGVAAFIDAEHALDPSWAARLGVNMDDLIISQPDSGEQALDIAKQLAETGEVNIIVIDSVAALVPQAELDGEITDSSIGAQARLMSKAMRMLKGRCSDTGTTMVFINQIRDKIGVMYGCLHADTMINFVDGRSLPIFEVVDKQIGGEVWSYDSETSTFVPRKIIDWHYNGDVASPSDWVSIAIRGPGTKNGRMHVTATKQHELMSDAGWARADSLTVNSKLLTKQPCFVVKNDGQPNGTLGQFLTGVLSGDSHIAKNADRLAYSLKVRDNIDPDYATWKISKLQRHINFATRGSTSREYHESDCASEFLEIKRDYPKRDPMLLLDRFSWLGFAIWLMDDAVYERGRYNLSIRRFAGDHDKIEQISRKLDELGIYHYPSASGRIMFDKLASDKIAESICQFVPPCMERKLPPELRGKYVEFELDRQTQLKSTYAEVVEIREASGRQAKAPGKYDLTIEGTSCYSAGGSQNGVIVHNSPETTPGGKALKFYASVRISIRGGNKIGKKDAAVGKEIHITVVKNKVGPPFGKTKFDLMFDKANDVWGVNKTKSLVDAAVTSKIIALSGSNYTYDAGDGSPVVKVNGHAKLCDAISELDAAAIALLREQTYKVILADGRGTPSEELSDEELAESLEEDQDEEEFEEE